MRVSELDYDLPPSLIAQHPEARRDKSRLLVYDRVSGLVDHRRFAELPDVLPGGELVLAVGTTTVRVLETLARGASLSGRTDLFITPGFKFLRTDALLTNFHLPRSTLLALVMAFAGVKETRRLYRLAIEERYRFYSFGDAMLIL